MNKNISVGIVEISKIAKRSSISRRCYIPCIIKSNVNCARRAKKKTVSVGMRDTAIVVVVVVDGTRRGHAKHTAVVVDRVRRS